MSTLTRSVVGWLGVAAKNAMPRQTKPQNVVQQRVADERSKRIKEIMSKGQPSEPVDWSAVDGAALAYFVAVVANEGGAVTLGYTRGQAAFRIGVYLADERQDMYFTDIELMYGWMKSFTDDLGAL